MDVLNTRQLTEPIGQRLTSERALIELLENLASMMYLNGYSGNLRPAHWVALRYFHKANRSAATVLGFARYYGVTKGTASQTISVLVRRGLLERTPSESDRRSHFLSLTADGKQILRSDPHRPLIDVVAKLSEETRQHLALALNVILKQMVDGRAVS